MKPTFFKTSDEFRKWLEKNFSSSIEILIGIHKTKSVKKGITYKEALHEALCYGWIDGVRKNLDEHSYTIRFTPRKGKSIWSNVNIRYVEELLEMKRMKPSGITAFEKRLAHKSGIYSYEQEKITALEKSLELKFRKNKKAWKWYSKKAPSYIKLANFWVMSGKKEETRLRRLENLITACENQVEMDQWLKKK